MKVISGLVVICCAVWQAAGYPYYPYYGDSVSIGSSDNTRGGMVMSRYYNPYYNPRAIGGMAAFMFKPPETHYQSPSQYYLPENQPQNTYVTSPQQNEVYVPQVPEKSPQIPEKPTTEAFADVTERAEVSTTLRAPVPELIEPESEPVEHPTTPKRRVSKKKQVKKPVEDEEEEDETPRMPAGAFFPMYFGWGGRSSDGGGGGATAIANAYSTGRGGVATSHATAYGAPRPDEGKL